MTRTSERMRITFVLPYAGISGGIRVIAIYAQRLQERGHCVTAISQPYLLPGRLARARVRVGGMFRRLRAEEAAAPSHFNGLDVEHRRLERVRPVIDADVPDADVVVATWWETAPWVAQLSPRKGAKAYFVQDYGAHEGQPINRVAETWHLPFHKIVISRWLMKLIEQHAGPSEMDYVPNAVDHTVFNAPPRGKQRRPTVGLLYNIAPQKGCDVMFRAIEIARRSCPELEVVGYGPDDPVQAGLLPSGARFWQCAPDCKLREIYSACDAWLFASRLEGFGLPILEAMACRTPVIGTPAGAAPELICEGGGILVKPNDPYDMARAIRQIACMSDSQWRSMSDSAFATASRLTWDEATDRFEAALRNAVAKRRRRPELVPS